MSNKSSSPGQVISLPKGGGALHGIGEKFAPDLHTGTGNFTVPIALPPGRNGFQPQLSLVYSTGNGNGPFGLGWSLGIPGVSRKTSKGVPRYDNSLDTFILSGAEDLVPISETPPNQSSYRPRTEGLFARIIHHHNAGNDYWEVRSKDGLVSFYGTQSAAGNDAAALADPHRPDHIFAWKLTETRDPFGNRIEYGYEADRGEAEFHEWNQPLLRQIRYADFTDQGQTKFLVTVTFEYEDRPDAFSEYRAGFEIRMSKRCRTITVSTHADQERAVRSYGLHYENDSHNGVSLLRRINVDGHDGDKSESLPPLEFGYTRFEPEKRDFFPFTGPGLPPNSLAHPEFETVSLFGNGLPDILEMNGVVRYWRNRGDGRFDLPREMQTAPGGFHLADREVQLIDANGDGRMDLLINNDGVSGYFPLRFGGLWDRRSFQPYHFAPSFDLEDPEVRLVDLDGDGVTDAIRSGSRLECFFNDSKEGWRRTRNVERRALKEFPNVNFSDPRVKWADMTGDLLQDIVLLHDGNVEYWPNLGHGDWGKRISTRNSPRFPEGYDPRRILVGDVDGDGLADIVYVDHRKVILWLNRSGDGWSDPVVIHGTPPATDIDAVRLVDALGTGISGVLWSRDADGLSRERMFFLDFTGGVKPYLLGEMNNHMGAITRVGYAPSIRFYLEDEKRPETRWKTTLPFPVQVVARVEVIDEISSGKLTTEYSYHHGYWDGAEREFRGFGRVDQRDTEVFQDFHGAGLHPTDRPFEPVLPRAFSPPTESRTWFHQGPVGDEFGDWEETDFSNEFWPGDPQSFSRPGAMTDFIKALPRRDKRDALRTLRGRILRTEMYARDGSARQDRPYTVTEHLHGVREESPPGAADGQRRRIFFPHALAERTSQWERGDEPMTQFGFTGNYDQYGQPRSQISVAAPRRRDYRVAAAPGEPYLATHAVTTYAQRDDAQRYIVDRVARSTSFEVLNDGGMPLLGLLQSIEAGTAQRRVFSQTLNFYDGPEFQGLPFGQIGEHGAVVRAESLIFTQEILREAYKSGDTVLSPAEEPPYLATTGAPVWPAEYPQEFRDLLPPLAGYVFQAGGAGSNYETGYFAATERRHYDFHDPPGGQTRGMIKVKRDPLGRDTTISYDNFDLLPVEVADPAGLKTEADYDYRVLQPLEVTDPNGNRTRYAFTPLGLLESMAAMGKATETLGDTPAAPSMRLTYDFAAFEDRQQPISVRTIRRAHHVNETDVPLPRRDETIETVEYSDGFGRMLQTRTQAEDVTFGDPIFGGEVLPVDQSITPGDAVGRRRADADPPRVVVSGWQIYDNKGRVVEKFEPFFSEGWDYATPADSERGRKVTMFYDPRGHAIRSVYPDDSEQRVVLGVPGAIAAPDLTDPDLFEPTPWETFTYDNNDNAGRTHAATSTGYQDHWNTPSSAVIDALGRMVETIERNGPNPAADWFTTRSTYDIQGNLLTVRDALGRVAFKHVYDLAKHALRTEQLDAGLRRVAMDAATNVIEQRDSKGALILQSYDVLNRPIRLLARDDVAGAVTLRERLEYGDGGDPNQPVAERNANRAVNRLGKLFRHYDEAGLLTIESYDFKGNVAEKTRRVISDATILSVFNPQPANWQIAAFRVNWAPPAGVTLEQHANNLLDATVYQTSFDYDALNRLKSMRYPQDVTGARKELRPDYNRAGALENVKLDGATFVEHIAYNAKGQRTLIAYGAGVMTRYAYHPETFRLARMRTERYAKPDDLTYRPAGAPLQEFGYDYDLAGNITAMRDRTPGSGVPGTLSGVDALDRQFTYDPIYRLLLATGRECATPPPPQMWDDAPKCHDVTLTRGYTEEYHYDAVGNLDLMSHIAGPGGFNRDFAFVPNSNRLDTVTVSGVVNRYVYDANGNLTDENTSRHFEWGHNDRMRVYRTQTSGSEPSVHAHYLYDTGGQRVKKLARKQGGATEVTVYIDGVFEHRIESGASPSANNELHVMDDQKRVAMARVGPTLSGDASPAVKFHLGDHLGSSNVVIDDTGAFINREEHTPYGETSFGGFARKRYRFTGKERDEESGLYYHGARYYAPWLGRWISPDPLGMISALNLYLYVLNNPVNSVDTTGMQDEPAPADRTAAPNSGSQTTVQRAIQHSLTHAPNRQTNPAVDPGLERVTGVRDPSMSGASLAPHAQYFNPRAAEAAAAGFTHWAELVEAGHGCSACHVTHDIGRIPTNEELDLGRYNNVSRGMFVSRQVLEFALAVGGARASSGGSTPPETPPTPPRSGPPAPPAGRPSGGSPPPSGGGSGGGGRPIRSRYADGTPVYKDQRPPRLGEPRPLPEAQGPHSQLRWDTHNQRVYQGREFDAAGRPVRDIDFTSPTYPSGAPRPDHLPPPHQHRWTPSPTGGSPSRGGAEPL